MAIAEANKVLGWLEGDLRPDEVPDEKIWHHPGRLKEHFEAVKQRRDNGHQPIDLAEDVPMESNALVDEFLNRGQDEDEERWW